MASEQKPKGKDLGTPVGIVMGFVIIFIGISVQKSSASVIERLTWFGSPSAFFIVLGSTVAAAMVAIPFNSIKTIPAVIGITVRSLSFDYLAVIQKMCDLASIGRKDGLFALEKHAREIEDPFFSNYLEQATFERDSKKLKDNMDMEMNNIASRHEAGAELFTFMGTYAPAFGMMGTVMGLIIMMFGFDTGGGGNVAEKFRDLLQGMATALITTLYGVVSANLIFLPIAAKLERRSINELRHKEIVAQGILMLHAKEHPILIKEKLMNFVPKDEKKEKKSEKSDTK